MLPWDKQKNKWLVPLIIAAIVAALTGSTVYSLALPVNAAAAGDTVVVVIPPGMTTKAIGELLDSKGLLRSAALFRAVVSIEGAGGKLQAGEYVFSKAMTAREIVGKLVRGETGYRQFTIPEGFTIDQIAALLESQNIVPAAKFKAYAAGAVPYDYINPAANVKYKSEGFLFPDTYRISSGTGEEQIFKMMAAQFDRQFTPAMRSRAAELGLSVRQVVILASLVEKEAQQAKERPVIAGVFLGRLKQEMPLQSCATIQYILGYAKPELTVQDTELPSPYNTYRNMGLPPGPIASPGLAAIQAVLYPAATDYLYFVAGKDGSHVFSRTYEEHLAAIDQVSN